MYDMYRWSPPDPADDTVRKNGTRVRLAAHRMPRGGAPAPAPEHTASAIQVALDRRDNGGDSGAARGQ